MVEEEKFKTGDKVFWLGKEAEVHSKSSPAKWLVWTGTNFVEVWESELIRISE